MSVTHGGTKKQKRNGLMWIAFDRSDVRGGYAVSWFFYVHAAFKAALDIRHVERVKNKIKVLVETEGEPMQFSFSKGDSLNSRCGNWSVQVDQSIPDSLDRDGIVGFSIYTRNQNPIGFEGVWKKHSWLSVTQAEFVKLLRTGSCAGLSLMT